MSDGSKNPRLRIVTAISLCNSSGCRFVITTILYRYFIAVLFSFSDAESVLHASVVP